MESTENTTTEPETTKTPANGTAKHKTSALHSKAHLLDQHERVTAELEAYEAELTQELERVRNRLQRRPIDTEASPARRGRPRKAATSAAPANHKASKGRDGRLPRRSAEEIDEALAQVVAIVKKSKEDGLRAEQIRQQLKMEAKEMPRILKVGIAKKILRSKGEKRSTTYFAK